MWVTVGHVIRLILPTPAVQNGGMARNGLKETGLISIKNGMFITMANGIIGNVIWGI